MNIKEHQQPLHGMSIIGLLSYPIAFPISCMATSELHSSAAQMQQSPDNMERTIRPNDSMMKWLSSLDSPELNSSLDHDLPLRPSSHFDPGEDSRRLRLRMIEDHVARWTLNVDSLSEDRNTPSVPMTVESSDSSALPEVHRALFITEILENILCHVGQDDMSAVVEVCHTWCDTAAYMLRTTFREHWPCAPIEYGQIAESNVPSRRPNPEDLNAYIQELLHWGNHPDPPWKPSFRPACFHQDLSVPKVAGDAFRSLYWYRDAGLLPECQWLDLSQLELNPYFMNLFGQRIKLKGGFLELQLLPGNATCITAQRTNLPGFQQVFAPMFATQPPCKALGLYVHASDHFTRLKMLRNNEGIRLDELLQSIHQTLPKVQEAWAKQVRTAVEEEVEEDAKPLVLQTDKAWRCMNSSISPRMIILLESVNGSKDNISNEGYGSYNVEWRGAFQKWHKTILV